MLTILHLTAMGIPKETPMSKTKAMFEVFLYTIGLYGIIYGLSYVLGMGLTIMLFCLVVGMIFHFFAEDMRKSKDEHREV